MTSPVTLDLEGVPLKTTLRLMLKQLGLAYCVKDGLLIISSLEGILQELEEAEGDAPGEQEPDERGSGRHRRSTRDRSSSGSRPVSRMTGPSPVPALRVRVVPLHRQLDDERASPGRAAR